MDNIKNDKYYLLKIINDIDKVISYSKEDNGKVGQEV